MSWDSILEYIHVQVSKFDSLHEFRVFGRLMLAFEPPGAVPWLPPPSPLVVVV